MLVVVSVCLCLPIASKILNESHKCLMLVRSLAVFIRINAQGGAMHF